MNGAIGDRVRQVANSRTLFAARYASGAPVRVPSLFCRRGRVPAQFSIAVLWLATTGMAKAAPVATWSLLPEPADVQLAASGVVRIVDGAPVAVRGGKREQPQPTVDRFMVAETRGLQLHAAIAEAHPAITFELAEIAAGRS